MNVGLEMIPPMIPYLVVDKSGRVLNANPAACELLRLPESGFAQLSLIKLFNHSRAQVEAMLQQCVSDVDYQTLSLELVTPANTPLSVTVQARQLDADTNSPILLTLFPSTHQHVRRDRTFEQAILKFLEITSLDLEHDFFGQFARCLAEVFNAKGAAICQRVSKGQAAEILGIYGDEDYGNRQRYALENTPCSVVYLNHFYHLSHLNAEGYDQSHFFARSGASDYLGLSLRDQNGAPMGHVCVYHDASLPYDEHHEKILQLFAARAIGEMARKKAEDAFKEINSSLERRVYERTIEMEQALILARDAAQTKSEFLANMSHEIRTPMNGVLGMLHLVKTTELSSEQQNYVDIARRSAETLLTILNDILDFSKIESGQLTFEAIEFDVQELVEDVAELLSPIAHAKGVELVVNIDALPSERVISDPTRLRQMITNLVANAIKFTDKGEVVIRLRALKAEHMQRAVFIYEVEDTGIGIAEDKLGMLFQPFKQADGSTTRKYGGTGLGLAITKQLSKLMRGTLGVESEEGEGSKFWIHLPMKVVVSQVSSQLDSARFDNEFVLIVDDNASSLTVLEMLLKRYEISFESVASAGEALERLKSSQKKFTLLLSDVAMPGMNGVELHDAALALPGYASLKTVLLGASVEGDLYHHCRDRRVSAVISKPVRGSVLYSTLLNLICHEPKEITSSRASSELVEENVKAPKRKVLVAEDHVVNQSVIKGFLIKLGYVLDVANNGREAVNAILREEYDLVLMDCQMPEMDGYEATRYIRGLDNGRSETPIVAMTANAMEGDEQKCLQAGMNDYLAKPVSPMSLKKMLEKHICLDKEEA